MKTRNILLSIALVILVASFALAATSISISPSDLTFSQGSNNHSFIIENTGDDTVSISLPSNPTITQGSNQVTFNIAPNQALTNIAPGNTRAVNVSISGNLNSFNFGQYSTSANIVATNASGTNVSSQLNLQFVRSFCSNGAQGGNLSIKDIDLTSSGDDDETWQPLDNVEIEVEIENNGNEDVDDVQVEIALYDTSGDDFGDDLDFTSADEEQIDLGTIRDDDSETVTFEFTVPSDFDTGNYKLAIKAYSDDLGESKECIDSSSHLDNTFFNNVEVEKEDDEGKFILVDDIQMPAEATCGETITGSFNLVNVGNDNQDQIEVNIVNKELGINEEVTLREDLDEGDDKTIDFQFDLPQSATDKTYSIEFTPFYDYRNGNYRQESDESFTSSLRLIGCSSSSGNGNGQTGITASLASDAIAGKTLVVEATITNLGSTSSTFTIDADGYNSWADLRSVTPRVFTLNAGESKEVTFTFDVNTDAEGDQSFTIESDSSGQTESQEVQVSIESTSTSGSQLPGLLGNNSTLWIIGLVNLVLIILIIVVAIKLARR